MTSKVTPELQATVRGNKQMVARVARMLMRLSETGELPEEDEG